MTNNEKKFIDASISEVEGIMISSKQGKSYCQKLIQDFLGETDEANLSSLSEVISLYYRRLIGSIFMEFLEEKGFKIVKMFGGDNDYVYPFEFETIEVSLTEKKKVISTGNILIEKKSDPNLKLVFAFEYYSHEHAKLEVHSKRENAEEAEKFVKEIKEYGNTHNYLKNKKITPEFTFIEANPSYTWDSVILDDKTKKKILKNLNIILTNLPIYQANNVQVKRGMILKGVPGVGKTLIGKILCNQPGCTLIWVTPKYLESSKNVAAIIEAARELSPTILFLEDIDLYGSTRDSAGNRTLLGELMNQLDGVQENKNIIVIATTNRGDDLERALRNRPGRFDEVIEIKKPEPVEREKMIRLYSSKFICDSDIDFKSIAEQADKYTGAHIKDLVDLAVMSAIENGSYTEEKKVVLKHKYFESNIKRVGEKKIEISDAFKTTSNEPSRSLESYLDD